jgi:hypothetical protein
MTLAETLAAMQSRADSLARIYAVDPLAGEVTSDLAALLSAAQNVLALHSPHTETSLDWPNPYEYECCRHCHKQWPCPTVIVLTDALEGGK